jgi:hypothetical protein
MSQIPSKATYTLQLMIERKVVETAEQRILIRLQTLIETSFLLKNCHDGIPFFVKSLHKLGELVMPSGPVSTARSTFGRFACKEMTQFVDA